jgi:molybdopterin-guanine dinucleotide biosynthesis protein A
MGREKATLPLDGVPLALRVTAVAATVATPVVLVAPAGHPAGTLGHAVVADPGIGPLGALAAAFEALAAEHVLVLGCDHPRLVPELLALLVELRRSGQAVVCEQDGRLQGLVAVYQRDAALAAARDLLADGQRSLRSLLAVLGVRIVTEAEWREVDPGGHSFLDADRPADLRGWATGLPGGG